MKKLDTYTRAVNKLNKMFGYANEYFFNGELPKPTITVQSTAMAYAHITTDTVWVSDKGDSYELNISADYLNRPIENVVASLLHEMAHLYNMMNGIKDTSGYYHNKKFKKTAEEIAKLNIEQDTKYGWTITSPTEATLDFIIEYGLEDFLISRKSDLYISFGASDNNGAKPKTKRPKAKGSNSIKWICPCCGAIIRSTSEVNVICGDCNEKFIKA